MRIILFVILLLSVASMCYAQKQEELTLTTYYPAPYGEYDNLVTNSIQITGGNPSDGRVLTSDDDGIGTWQDVTGSQLGNYEVENILGPFSSSDPAEIAPILASTDGFVVAYSETLTAVGCIIEGYTDSNANPNTLVAQEGHPSNELGDRHCITFPVKKGNYWKIRITNGNSKATFRWIPLQ
jgi:hypothetical protein